MPGISEVERIAALGDPVIRNLQITQCYHELALAMVPRTGPAANWCTFATWASKQAGQTIRKQDLLRALQDALAAAPATRQAVERLAGVALQMGAQLDLQAIREAVWAAWNPTTAVDRASDAVGRGNLKVFAEIGREFARFLSVCGHHETFDAAGLADFCAGLRPGDPPEGQRYLRQAFTRYYRSFFETDAKRRAELVFMANLEIGLHEQTRLQPEIVEALEAGVDNPQTIAEHLAQAIFPFDGWLVRLNLIARRLLGRPTLFELAVRELLATARVETRRLMTETMMVISLPHGVRLRLGHDLSAEFPDSLKHIENAELRALLVEVDPTPDSLLDTGAVDWGNLADRLHFITDLFRCYQEDPDLFEPPFTPDQLALLKMGRVPGGEL